jgi:hypothetical protein
MSTDAQITPVPEAAGRLFLEAVVGPGGLEATLSARREPPDATVTASDAEVEEALAALRRAGVAHGIDRAAVAATVAAQEGAPRVVARATVPEPPVDAVLDLLFAKPAEESHLYSVAVGALLAHKIPASRGRDGIAVTGVPIPAARPRDPAVSAGAGAAETVGADGVIEIHATADGRPRLRGSAVAVDPSLAVEGVGVGGCDVRVRGSLDIAGDVTEGQRVQVSGRLTLRGIADHAHLEAGWSVAIAGSAVGTTIRAGLLQGVYGRVLTALGDADRDATTLCAMTSQLALQAAEAGKVVKGERALAALMQGRFPDLAAALGAAEEVASAPDSGLPPSIRSAVAEAAQAVRAIAAGEAVPLLRMRALAAALAEAKDEMSATAGEPGDVRAGYLQGCRVEAGGGLVITGAGTYNTDAVVAGDLLSEAYGATVRGGELRVGGRVRVRELGAPGEARVVVVLEGPLAGRDRLTAGVAHAGAEIVCRGRRVVVDRTTLNLAVGFDEEEGVVRSGLATA